MINTTNKVETREKFSQSRSNINPPDHQLWSQQIANNFLSHFNPTSHDIVGAYFPIKNEVNLIDHLLSRNICVAVPRISNKQTMHFVLYQQSSISRLQMNAYNIPEINGKEVVPDILCVPCLCFSGQGYRLGYGGGFYDKYLSLQKVYNVIIGFDVQKYNHFHIEEHDVRANAAVTEKEVLIF